MQLRRGLSRAMRRLSSLAWSLGVAAALGLGAAADAAGQLAVDSMVRTLRPAADSGGITVLVRNLSDYGTGVKVELADWEVLPGGEHRFHPAGSLPGSCGSRVVVEPATARVQGAAAIPFRVSWPGAVPERCRIMVWFRTDDIDLDDGEGTSLVVRTGVKVHVEPAPPG